MTRGPGVGAFFIAQTGLPLNRSKPLQPVLFTKEVRFSFILIDFSSEIAAPTAPFFRLRGDF